jgi:non-ribosomal peptide synthetase component F
VALQWQNEEVLTYRMLDYRANKLARHFESYGLKCGDFACLLLEKSPMMIVAILAILKVGAAYVPLSLENPIDRNAFIIDEVRAKVLLLARSVDQSATYGNVDVIHLDELDVSKYPNTLLNISISGRDVAYVIYTSGSTGKPKGCVLSHSAAAAAVESMIQTEHRSEGE